MAPIATSRWLARIGPALGLLQLILGIAVWMGVGGAVLGIHMLGGLVFSILLLVMAIIGARGGASRGRVGLGIGLAVFLPVFGIMHGAILGGGLHWIVQVLHVGVGVFAMMQFNELAPVPQARTPRAPAAV